MLEKIKYVNSRGEVLNFGENGVYVNENDLRDWEWSYNTDYGRIRQFRRSSITRTLPVQIWATSEEKGLEVKNRLHDVTEVDVIAETPGRLYIGDCYMKCYVVGSTKSNYLTSRNILSVDLMIAASEGVWYQESVFWFGDRADLDLAEVGTALVGFARVGSRDVTSEGTAVYDYGYPRGYRSAQEQHSDRVVNNFLVPCGFRLEINGPASNPEIIIGDSSHKLNCRAEVGQTIVVDSRERTIKIVRADGSETNAFRYRDKKADVFATIEPGAHAISWNGDFLFNLTLYKERSEPLWT